MYFHVIKICGLGSVLCLMQMLHAMKNFQFRIFIVPLHTLSFMEVIILWLRNDDYGKKLHTVVVLCYASCECEI